MEEKKMYKEELPSTSGTASSAKQEQWSKLIEVNFCCSWVNTTTTHKKGHDTTETTTIISHKCVSKETCFVYRQKKSYKPFSFSVSMTEWTKYGLVDQWDSCRQLAAGFWSTVMLSLGDALRSSAGVWHSFWAKPKTEPESGLQQARYQSKAWAHVLYMTVTTRLSALLSFTKVASECFSVKVLQNEKFDK